MDRACPRLPLPDDVIEGRFHVAAELGRGGMSVVYRAHDRWTKRDVALKVLTVPEEDTAGTRFLQREFRAMTRLRHPRLVEVYDYGLVRAGMPFFTMELLPGRDLSAVRRLALAQVFEVVVAVSEALAFMHARGYVHRDVKPANVRLVSLEAGRPLDVKLMDCGLVTRVEDEAGGLAGTPTHLAPEVWLGAAADVRTDLYSLGVLAYEITAGRLPFEGATGAALLARKTRDLPDLREHRPDVPPGFARLVRELIAADPARRPVSAFEVLARLSQFAAVDLAPAATIYLRAPPLVGRARELGELRELVQATSRGPSALAVIVAPPGAGKTRLLEEVVLEAELRGDRVARASGRGFGGAPYQVLGELLGPLLRSPEAAEPLWRVGGSAALRPLEGASTPATDAAPVDPIGARRDLYAALRSLLEDLTRGHPLLLAVDDLHLVDAASLDALSAILDAGAARITLLGTLTDDRALPPPVRALLGASRRVELDRLTEAEIAELLERTLGQVRPSPALLGEIRRYSGGNVSFVLEILRGLAQRGLIRPLSTKLCLPEALDAAELPQSLPEALARRVAALSPTALRVAQVVAVAGRAIELDLVRRATELDDRPFLDALDELHREEVVAVRDLALSLHDPRLQEVIYQGLSAESRAALHHRLAVELERRFGDDPRERSADLGRHFALGGDAARALDYLVLAGDQRYDGFAYVDAGEAYRRALRLLPAAPPRKRLALDRKLNDRLGRIGFYEDHHAAPPHLERARELHLHHGLLWGIPRLAGVLGARLAVALCLTATVIAGALRGRARPLREALEHLLDAFAATAYLCNCYTYTGRQARALVEAEALRPLVYSRRRLPRAGYLIARGPALVFTHRLHAGAAACEEALAVLERDRRTLVAEPDRVNATGGALVTRLWADLGRGYCQSPWWPRVEEYVRRHPTVLLETWLLELRLFTAYRRGYFAAARGLWQQLAEKARLSAVFFVQGKGRVWHGLASLGAGHTGEALDVAEEVIGLAREHDNPMVEAMGLHLRGMALHAWEHYDEAARAFEQAAALALREDVDAHGVYRDALLGHAALTLDLGRAAEARALVARAEEATPPVEPPHELHRLRALRLRGQIAHAEGEPAAARAALLQALELAELLEDAREAGLTAHALSGVLAELGEAEQAAERDAQARRLLRDHGAPHELGRLAGSKPPRPRPPAASSVFPRAEADGSLDPESMIALDPSSRLGDTQPGLDASSSPAAGPREVGTESVIRVRVAEELKGEP